jgi:hypothetical protein
LALTLPLIAAERCAILKRGDRVIVIDDRAQFARVRKVGDTQSYRIIENTLSR